MIADWTMDLTTQRSERPFLSAEPNQVNPISPTDDSPSTKQLGSCPQARAAKSVFSIRSIVDDLEDKGTKIRG